MVGCNGGHCDPLSTTDERCGAGYCAACCHVLCTDHDHPSRTTMTCIADGHDYPDHDDL